MRQMERAQGRGGTGVLKCVILSHRTGEKAEAEEGEFQATVPSCCLCPMQGAFRAFCLALPQGPGKASPFPWPLPVSELMGDGECQRQARVFVDVTAPVRLAHA